MPGSTSDPVPEFSVNGPTSSVRPAPTVSVVLPCFRAAPVAGSSVRGLQAALQAAAISSWEILVVDDGGHDFPPDFPASCSPVRLLRLPRNRGKGAAVAFGLLHARGRVRVFTDVDLPYGTAAVLEAARTLLRSGAHLVIGDRSLPGSSYHLPQPRRRRWLSRICSRVVGRGILNGFPDTQCGLKGLRGDVAEALVPRLRVRRFAFDIELLRIATLYGLEIRRLPVRLHANTTSTVRPLRDALRAALDVAAVELRLRRGVYESDALRVLAPPGHARKSPPLSPYPRPRSASSLRGSRGRGSPGTPPAGRKR